jgi:hypothetical protein
LVGDRPGMVEGWANAGGHAAGAECAGGAQGEGARGVAAAGAHGAAGRRDGHQHGAAGRGQVRDDRGDSGREGVAERGGGGVGTAFLVRDEQGPDRVLVHGRGGDRRQAGRRGFRGHEVRRALEMGPAPGAHGRTRPAAPGTRGGQDEVTPGGGESAQGARPRSPLGVLVVPHAFHGAA